MRYLLPAACAVVLCAAVARGDTVYWASGNVWTDVTVIQIVDATDGTMVLLRRGEEGEPSWYREFREILIDPRLRPQDLRPAAAPTPPPPVAQAPTPTLPPISGITFEDIVRRFVATERFGQSDWLNEWQTGFQGKAVQWTGEVVRLNRLRRGEGSIVYVRQLMRTVPEENLAPVQEPGYVGVGEPIEGYAEYLSPDREDVAIEFIGVDLDAIRQFRPGTGVIYIALLGPPPERRQPLQVEGLTLRGTQLPAR